MAHPLFSNLTYRIRWGIRSRLCAYPLLYLPIAVRRHPLLVRRTTDLVFEGFFRCGNTFAFEAFRMAQSAPMRIARHIHAPAQVLFAVRRGIPVLLSLRDPLDCIPSLLLFEPRIGPEDGLKAYTRYYSRLAPVLDRCVTASFEQITTDFSEVCRRLNRKYGTRFGVFEHTSDNVEACFKRMEQLTRSHFGELVEDKTCRPSPNRDQRRINLAQEAERDPGLKRPLREALQIYRACLVHCDSHGD